MIKGLYKVAWQQTVLMGVIYCFIALSLLPCWHNLGFRPLLFLPVIFIAQMMHIATPLVLVWSGFVWDSLNLWPIGLSSFFYLLSSALWPLIQRWVYAGSYMSWVFFVFWAILVYVVPTLIINFTYQTNFSPYIVLDLVFTACLFPVCLVLWPSGRSL